MKRSPTIAAAAPWIALGLAALVLPAASPALTAPPALASLEESDRAALERLASHPAPLREAALRASAHVDVLVETQRIQEQSSADFQERIEGLDRRRQEQIWQVVREPGLLEALAGGGPLDSAQIEAVAGSHRDELAPAIRALAGDHAALLAEVLAIQRGANDRFELLLETLPDDAARQAFRDLLEEPELLSLLARHVRLAVRLSDSERDDPDATRRHLAALGAEVALRDARARDEWVESIADDPDAAEELEASARAYAEEYGHDYDALTDPAVRTRIEVVVHPYPYWLGYPHWYADVHLFPYGYWYHYPPHFGFYHHHHASYVWFGFPSLHFAHWFFGGHHHRHYRHLAHGFDRHFHRHRHARSVFHATLGNWVRWRDHRHGFTGRRDHRDHHRGRGHRGSPHGGGDGVQRGGDGGIFVSLFERARFERRGDRDRDHRPGDRHPPERRGRVTRPDPGGDDGRADRSEDGRPGRDERVERRRDRGDGERARDRGERRARERDGDGARGRDDDRARRRDDDRAPRRDGDRARDRDRSREQRAGRDRGRRDARPRVGSPERRSSRPEVRPRDARPRPRADRRGPTSHRRERGFSPRGRDRGPSVDRGHRSGGRRGSSHHAGRRGGGKGRGRR